MDPNKDLELIKKIESRIDYWAEGNGLIIFGPLYCSLEVPTWNQGSTGQDEVVNRGQKWTVHEVIVF